MMQIVQSLALLSVGLIAGLVNSVAGGGALLIYPLLLSMGISPIHANTTTTLAIWPGGLSSAYGYRKHLARMPGHYFWLLVPCLLGGLFGALILTRTSNSTFESVVPWFILVAVSLIALQPIMHTRIYTKKIQRFERKYHLPILGITYLLIFMLAVYGGYFGAGFGIIMLAFLGLTRLKDIEQMNGLKNLTGVVINAVASFYFTMQGLIEWHAIPILLSGCVVGGWLGATYSSKLPAGLIRKIIIVIGLMLAIYLFANPK